jgi:type I restriction enzyme, S subunit
MMTAPIKSLAEIAEFVQYGYTASASEHPVGPRFLRITDIVPSQIDWDSVPYCKIDEKAKSKFSLATGDIVIARTGATVGYAKLIRDNPESVFASYLVRIRVDHQLADPGYVGRIVESDVYKQFVMSRVGGAAQPNANAKVLSAFRLPIPNRSTQSRIVEILSAYDDLIENNRRRIQLLEQAAQLLYKEWFVHLRFPGHEHTKIKDGVPEGWEKKALGDLCVEVRETVSPNALEPNTPYIGLEHMPRRSITLCEWGQAEQVTSSKHRFREGDILFGKIRPYFHKVGLAFVDGVASSDAIVIRPTDTSLLALVLMATSSDGFVAVTAQQMKEGSKMPRADWKQMQQYPVPRPPDGVLCAFNDFIDPILTQLKALSFANHRLGAARDLLLPKLMNGEVEV